MAVQQKKQSKPFDEKNDTELRLVQRLYFGNGQSRGLLEQIQRKHADEERVILVSPSFDDVKSMSLVDKEHNRSLFGG